MRRVGPIAPVVVAVWLAVAASCTSDPDTAPETASPTAPESAAASEPDSDRRGPPAWQPSTRNAELAWRLATDGPSAQLAVDHLGLAVADFPGTSASVLVSEPVRSATYTIALAATMRDELTAAQRDALDAFGVATPVATISPQGDVIGSGPSEPAGWRAPRGRRPATGEIQRYSALFADVQARWLADLPALPQYDSYELRFDHQANKDGMWAEPLDGPPSKCAVTVTAEFRADNPSDDKISFYFAHELFHCMQFQWASGAEFWMPHQWVFDGSADWAAADLFRADPITFNDIREAWFTSAFAPLASRAYDAWPLFEIAALAGRPVYDIVAAMHANPRADVAEMLAVGGLDDELLRLSWSMRTLRQTQWEQDWWMDWVWRGHETDPPTANTIAFGTITLGSSTAAGGAGFSQPQLLSQVAPDVDILAVTPVGSPLATHTALGTRTIGDGDTARLCFDPSGCECPDDSGGGPWPMEDRSVLLAVAPTQTNR